MNPAYSLADPIVALSTPYGQSALALLRLSGDGVCQKIAPFFSRPQALQHPNTAVYGYFLDADGQALDEVILTCYYAPKSFTGEDVVEISTHGNMRLVDQIIAFLLSQGFRMALAGEFSYRATLLGKMDLIKAEAIHELINAKTHQQVQQAFAHLKGDLSHQLQQVYEELVHVGSFLRMHLDYPEDEVEALPSFPLSTCDQILTSLLENSRNLARWQEGARVVIAGEPNVGKSSLFNFLIQQDRALVSAVAGTTRDYLEVSIELEGCPIMLFDTAGLRQTEDAIEHAGIQKSLELLASADLILHLVTDQQPDLPQALHAYQEKVLTVMTKIDLHENPVGVLGISVLEKQGLKTLMQQIIEKLDFPKIEEKRTLMMLGSLRQRDLTQKALQEIHSFLAVQKQGDIDAMYFHITQASHDIGTLLGKHVDQDMIHAMFSQFCLGK